CTQSAADVGHLRANTELLLDAFERRDPGRHEVRVVPRAEESLAARGNAQVVLVPPKSGSGLERGLDLRAGLQCRGGQLEGSADESGAVLVRQGEGLLGGQQVPLRLSV